MIESDDLLRRTNTALSASLRKQTSQITGSPAHNMTFTLNIPAKPQGLTTLFQPWGIPSVDALRSATTGAISAEGV